MGKTPAMVINEVNAKRLERAARAVVAGSKIRWPDPDDVGPWVTVELATLAELRHALGLVDDPDAIR